MKNKNKSANVIVRTQSAGVFAGVLASRKGSEAVVTKARRLWYWAGAASLSQLAVDGTSNPSGCKFPVAVPEVTLLGVIEILPLSDKAKASIDSVPVWKS
jgi:hypothetical protein